MEKEELRKELIQFFDWYKKSPFSSSGRTEDLIKVYFGENVDTGISTLDLIDMRDIHGKNNVGKPMPIKFPKNIDML